VVEPSDHWSHNDLGVGGGNTREASMESLNAYSSPFASIMWAVEGRLYALGVRCNSDAIMASLSVSPSSTPSDIT
jgi:hypothetical protein